MNRNVLSLLILFVATLPACLLGRVVRKIDTISDPDGQVNNDVVPGCTSLMNYDWIHHSSSQDFPSCFCDKDAEAFDDDGLSVSVICLNLTNIEALKNAVKAVNLAGKRLFSLTINGSQLADGTFVGGFFDVINATPVRFAIKFCFNEKNSTAKLALGPEFFNRAQKATIRSFVITDCILTDSSQIPDQIKRLINLEQLHLNRVGLKSVQPDDLTGLDRMQILNLNDNEIKSIPEDLFSQTPNLRLLNLGSNDLDTSALKPLSKHQFDHVTILDLSDNNIDSLQDQPFSNFRKLRTLILSKNNISELPIDAFADLSDLSELLLDQNGINKTKIFLSSAHSLPNNLTTLDLSDNFLTDLADFSAAANLASLKTLLLDHNLFTSVPASSLSKLTNLTSLYLNFNDRLSTIEPNAFKSLKNLKLLDLSFTSLSIFDSTSYFEPDSPLIYLSLAGTNLSSSNSLNADSFSNVPHLATLDLYSTSLATVKDGLLDPLKNLTLINLAGNPFRCDKKLAYLIDWLNKHVTNEVKSLQFRAGQFPICAEPKALFGLPLAAVSLEHIFFV